MALVQNGTAFQPPHYMKVLLLGAIAAASAFVVTILIVLLCVGCHRKRKTKNGQTGGEQTKILDSAVLRQTKLRSFSKSDTRLHEMSRPTCNGNSASKNRPASMDPLYLSSRHSNANLSCPLDRHMLLVPPTPREEQEHTYSEVGLRVSLPRCPDDGLYESVGTGTMEPATEVPPSQPHTHSPAPGKANGNVSNGKGANGALVPDPPVTAEYACIRKVRKVDKPKKKESRAEPGEPQQRGSNTDLHTALYPPHPRSQEALRNTLQPFQIQSFPKEVVFMGNGEQYIWKPPEEEDVAVLQPRQLGPLSTLHGEKGDGHTEEISDMYSKVCKPTKKKRIPTSPPSVMESNGQRNPPHSSGAQEGVASFNVAKSQAWAGGGQPSGPGGGPPAADPCYETIGDKAWPRGPDESDVAYEIIDANWKREGPPNATLKLKKKKPPLPAAAKALPGENFYESISDLKQGVASSSTTTIFTFNDGMEMYVTGL